MGVLNEMKNNILLFDGGLGTMLQQRGLPTGELPERYNISHPDIVRSIHEDYVKAGADVITANTFQANPLKMEESEYLSAIEAGIRLVKESGARYTAMDIGPLGQMIEPLGTFSWQEAYDIFKAQAVQAEKSGADCVIIETISDLLEAKIAILAVKENTKLPVFCTLTFQEDGRTFMGTDPLTAVVALEDLGVDALGVNCSLGPKELMPIVEEMLTYCHVPVMVQGNAGLPEICCGETVYKITPEEFRDYSKEMLQKGVRIIGGCCGTTPEFIAQLDIMRKQIKTVAVTPKNITAITSSTKTVVLDKRVSVIGERINPTGKKKLKEALLNHNLEYIIGEAINQTDAGSDILDVNVGLPDIDEPAMQVEVIREIQSVTDLPLQIDSSDIAAIEAGVRIYNGKPLINSVNGKKENLKAVLPIVKKYGAAVIGLTLDESGIPDTAEGRFAIAEKILAEALKYGIRKENVLIDCLVLTASAQQEQVMETLNAIKLVKSRLGLKTVLGVSNISFGLPSRNIVNATFLAAAFGAGLDAPILNPLSEDYRRVVDSFRVLNNQDSGARFFIEQYHQTSAQPTAQNVDKTNVSLQELILQGRKEEAAAQVRNLLSSGATALSIIDNEFVPALNIVGERFETQKMFLPQLMQSAESVKAGFKVIKNHMEKAGEKPEYKAKILLATVEGDIHDIGKNIVAMILENYGYEIFDLGKDVPAETIVQMIQKHEIKLVGLSALMTTTVQNMKKTIEMIHEKKLDCKIMVGGAVLNEEYAEFVGADFYARNAMDSVEIANRLFG
ncbi:homocysteine S-methyltransferase family protein [Scatolibacter rhodanostii]|uniref:homocysteine S-methyltransferase family protein n=1 Tax=Scatolibacter rhodanostii TaxID=2014781 RepID=UPI00117E2091|nr:homocysteine S-methyltransferase family protein [Scatolibacter rhodanostii]